MDNTEFHVLRGDDALNLKDYSRAQAAYGRGLQLAPADSAALSGKAVTTAYLAARPGIGQLQKDHALKSAEELLAQAIKSAQNDQEKLRVHSFGIQVYVALQQPENWFEKATDSFEKAVSISQQNPEPYFYMARAEAAKFNFSQAVQHYNKVLTLNKKYLEETNRELVVLQKIQRAQPGSRFGKEIALVEKITRADMSALLIAELRLDRLYQQKQQVVTSTFSAPATQQRLQADHLQKVPEAFDIAGNPLEETIKEVLKLNVKGLEADASHKFYPQQPLRRAEFALLLQDILVKITSDRKLATKYFGEPSPFPDVRNSVYYYNAVRIVVERGWLKVSNPVTGEFSPGADVSGADALLIIRDLKEIARSALR